VTDADITALARQVGRAAKRRQVVVATAESCTGGGVAEALTRISGSSAWFDRGFVTYANAAKVDLLGVSPQTLAEHGAVSEAVAREMAAGALRHSPCDVSVAVTGIAGPGGGSAAKPVGLVWFAWAVRGGPVQCRDFRFKGGRSAVRAQAVAIALRGLADLLRTR
jgi:nicotinamide-nucleotide amidase